MRTTAWHGALNIRLPLVVLAMSLLLTESTPAKARTTLYSFTEIAAPDELFTSFTGAPSISDLGDIAFFAFLKVNPNRFLGTRGIFTGNGGPPTTVVSDDGPPFSTFGVFPSINNSRTVAFQAGLTGDADGIFIGSGGPITTIAHASLNARGGPSINEQGTVAFQMSFDFNTRSGIFTGSGGPITPIITAGVGSPFNGFGNPSINDFGTVAFAARLNDSSARIITGRPERLTTVADTRDGIFKDFGFTASINNHGTVVFTAELRKGGAAVVIGGSTPLTAVGDTSGPFSWFDGSPDINDEGVVVFHAGLDAGGSGLFAGPDPKTDKVIAVGDALFGSTVIDLSFARGGLNGGGEIAFLAALADQRTVIVRASPIPGPSSKDACKRGGWRNFGPSFRNQGDCVSWLNKGGR